MSSVPLKVVRGRMNRQLLKRGQQIRKLPGGGHYIIDTGDRVIETDVDVEKLARALGVLEAGEVIGFPGRDRGLGSGPVNVDQLIARLRDIAAAGFGDVELRGVERLRLAPFDGPEAAVRPGSQAMSSTERSRRRRRRERQKRAAAADVDTAAEMPAQNALASGSNLHVPLAPVVDLILARKGYARRRRDRRQRPGEVH